MTTRIENILERLDGVKKLNSGSGGYIAKCPSHDDRSPSLSIRESDKGLVLLHCFAGCDTESVLSALGIKFSDLYPEPLGHHFKSSPMRTSPREILETLDHESLVVALIGADFIKRQSLDEETWSRLAKAVNRINSSRAQVAPLKKWHLPKTDIPHQSKEQA